MAGVVIAFSKSTQASTPPPKASSSISYLFSTVCINRTSSTYFQHTNLHLPSKLPNCNVDTYIDSSTDRTDSAMATQHKPESLVEIPLRFSLAGNGKECMLIRMEINYIEISIYAVAPAGIATSRRRQVHFD